MGWMAGVLDDPPGFPYTPPGVDVLEGGKLTSNNVAGSSHDPFPAFSICVIKHIILKNSFSPHSLAPTCHDRRPDQTKSERRLFLPFYFSPFLKSCFVFPFFLRG